jgi:hypothetical protein
MQVMQFLRIDLDQGAKISLLRVVPFEHDPIRRRNECFKGVHQLLSRQQRAAHPGRDQSHPSFLLVASGRPRSSCLLLIFAFHRLRAGVVPAADNHAALAQLCRRIFLLS